MTVKPSAVTGLYLPDVFSFGSLVGETGNAPRGGAAVVDAADYVTWRKLNTTSIDLPNDPNPVPIDNDQYNTWRTNFADSDSGSGGDDENNDGAAVAGSGGSGGSGGRFSGDGGGGGGGGSAEATNGYAIAGHGGDGGASGRGDGGDGGHAGYAESEGPDSDDYADGGDGGNGGSTVSGTAGLAGDGGYADTRGAGIADSTRLRSKFERNAQLMRTRTRRSSTAT